MDEKLMALLEAADADGIKDYIFEKEILQQGYADYNNHTGAGNTKL